MSSNITTRLPNGHSDPKARVRFEERGSVLLEALVAIVIFAFGVLGVVGLQANMVREQSASKFRSDAAYLANELTGLIWADIANIGNYAGYIGTGNCSGYARCKDWASKVAATLPSGSSAVTTNAASGDVQVTVAWAMPGGELHSYVMNTTIVAADKN